MADDLQREDEEVDDSVLNRAADAIGSTLGTATRAVSETAQSASSAAWLAR